MHQSKLQGVYEVRRAGVKEMLQKMRWFLELIVHFLIDKNQSKIVKGKRQFIKGKTTAFLIVIQKA